MFKISVLFTEFEYMLVLNWIIKNIPIISIFSKNIYQLS